MADGTPVTATVGNGGLTPSVLGAVEEWLAFNAPVRRAGERKGHLSFTSKGGLERGGDDSPCSRIGSLPSSEAEMFCPLEGRLATLERGRDAGRGQGPRRGVLERVGDCPAGSRGVRMGPTVYVGRVLGFFESFPFFQIGRRLWAFVGSVA